MKFTLAMTTLLLVVGAVMTGGEMTHSPSSSTTTDNNNNNWNFILTDAIQNWNSLFLDKLPDTGKPWTTLPNGIEFQPGKDLSPMAEYHVQRLLYSANRNSFNAGNDDEYNYKFTEADGDPYSKILLDGAETYYDEYAQAWRALGWYIDCSYCDGDDENSPGCKLLSNDDDDDQDDHYDNEDNIGCQRFMLWAAYIDEGYQGNGIGEYMYFDRKNNHWNDTACKESASTRCVKMDCHLPDSANFKLLGIFKEPEYDEWMEQLFKHQGDCVWTDEEYQFMQTNRQAWPTYCTKSVFKHRGQPIYYDVKPQRYGGMDIGLYTDRNCIQEYTGTDFSAEQVIYTEVCVYNRKNGGDDTDYMCNKNKNYNNKNNNRNRNNNNNQNQQVEGNLWSLYEDLKRWNDAFDIFKQCQPCKVGDLTYMVNGHGYKANADGSRYNRTRWWRDRHLGNNNNNNNNKNNYNNDDDDYAYNTYLCHDDAGYDNVNQCMKFAMKTNMIAADWQDVEIASAQGSLLSFAIGENNIQYGDGIVGQYKLEEPTASSTKRKMNPQKILATSMLCVTAGIFLLALYRFVAILRMARKIRVRRERLVELKWNPEDGANA